LPRVLRGESDRCAVRGLPTGHDPKATGRDRCCVKQAGVDAALPRIQRFITRRGTPAAIPYAHGGGGDKFGAARIYSSAMSGDRQLQVAIPLDDDGFIRRMCPSCDREFKDLASLNEGQQTPEPSGGYYCPYCGLQAGEWWTSEQSSHILALLGSEVIEPELRQLERDVERASTGLLRFSVDISVPDPPAGEMTEPNDMRRVDFPCHPDEPVKVLDAWSRPVYCRVCGAIASPSSS
jgi:hypothetical protein